MQRLSEDDDGAFAVRRDEHQVACVRLVAPGGVDAGAGRLHAGAYLCCRVVIPKRSEEMNLAGRSRELEERDSAAAARKRSHILGVRDLAGSRDARNTPERDVFDVT